MAKLSALFCITLLLCYTFAYGARPAPTVHLDHDQSEQGQVVATESCDGVAEEECLMRRTLAAHIDYIYTQKHHHP